MEDLRGLWTDCWVILFTFYIASSSNVVFQVVPIKDPVVLSKIHQTYRVGYLKVSVFILVVYPVCDSPI